MITTLDQYFKKETKQETEQTGYEYCKEKGYAHMPIKDIAKLIRADLKKAYGKDIKFSVTSCSYPRKIYVEIKKINPKYLMDKDEFKQHMINGYSFAESMYDFYMEPYSTECENGLYKFRTWHLKEGVEENIKDIMREYNYDKSEPMLDYYDVNFYTTVEVDHHGIELF